MFCFNKFCTAALSCFAAKGLGQGYGCGNCAAQHDHLQQSGWTCPVSSRLGRLLAALGRDAAPAPSFRHSIPHCEHGRTHSQWRMAIRFASLSTGALAEVNGPFARPVVQWSTFDHGTQTKVKPVRHPLSPTGAASFLFVQHALLKVKCQTQFPLFPAVVHWAFESCIFVGHVRM